MAALRDFEVLLDSGDATAEFWALKEAAVLQDRTARSLLRLTGPDRVSFLHGQTTNDVNGLADNTGHEAALLTNKGKMVGWARIFKRTDDLWVEADVGYGPKLLEHLQRSCISEEVEFEDMTGRIVQLGLYGPKASALLSSLREGAPIPELAEHQLLAISLGGIEVTLVGSRGGGLVPGFDLFVDVAKVASLWELLARAGESFGLKSLGETASEWARIEAGVVRYGVDLTEETNPLEANLERAISYNKGCYVGQEVIAKATFRGHVNKKLIGLRFEGELPALGSELHQGVGDEARMVGKVTSAAKLPDGRSLGLGFVKRDLAKPGVTLQSSTGALSTAALPFGAS
jgi:folate-binding protein YgfZ